MEMRDFLFIPSVNHQLSIDTIKIPFQLGRNFKSIWVIPLTLLASLYGWFRVFGYQLKSWKTTLNWIIYIQNLVHRSYALENGNFLLPVSLQTGFRNTILCSKFTCSPNIYGVGILQFLIDSFAIRKKLKEETILRKFMRKINYCKHINFIYLF